MIVIRYRPVNINSLGVDTHPHLAKVTRAWRVLKWGIYSDDILIMEDEPKKGVRHLRVRFFGRPVHSFHLLQQIKNDLWGKSVVAVEVYPRQRDMVDNSETYHLWSQKGLAVPNLKEFYRYA